MSLATTVVMALLGAAAALVLVRLWKGPSMLDRAVSVDTLLSIAVAVIGTIGARQRTALFLPILLVLAFLGFTGSVSMARFISVQDRAPNDPEENSETGPEGYR
ncbi:monovalent cation/H+ antiporter complex subunit F [Streptomyces sp. TP-A0874]|uniref:monovalent cation/H+ antiporter complex subunit F n=1 Tax=Streptomyces sp. TP-A0874 TaxID=549819 RepID=UPI0008531199|nr:MrpF/PhaF family protein [Streptomyces sp. TP-A0874]